MTVAPDAPSLLIASSLVAVCEPSTCEASERELSATVEALADVDVESLNEAEVLAEVEDDTLALVLAEVEALTDSDALVEAEIEALVEAEIERLSLIEFDVETEVCCSSSFFTVPKTAWSEVTKLSVPSTTFSTATCSLAWTCV